MLDFHRLISGCLLLTSMLLASVPWHILVVSSGSMAPALPLGSIILTQRNPVYEVGDVISYSLTSDKVITHRINAITRLNEKTEYQTQGDANNVADTHLVTSANILGRTLIAIPYLGYPALALQTKWGVILLVIVPCTVIVFEESKALIKGLRPKVAQ